MTWLDDDSTINSDGVCKKNVLFLLFYKKFTSSYVKSLRTYIQTLRNIIKYKSRKAGLIIIDTESLIKK